MIKVSKLAAYKTYIAAIQMYLIIINLMRKHLHASFLQTSFSFFYKPLLSLVLFSVISACGNNNILMPMLLLMVMKLTVFPWYLIVADKGWPV